MPKRLTLYHPTEVRTYGLKGLAVPPKQYARFLLETIRVFKGLVLQENKCQSLDEVAEKHARAMQRLNPGKTMEELDLDPPLTVWVDAELKYDKTVSRARKPNQPYRSTEYEEYLGLPKESLRIPLNAAEKDLVEFVDHLTKELDARFPQRNGKMPDHIFDKGGKRGIYSNISGFQFSLNLQSIPTLYLQASVRLVDFGGIFSGENLENGYFIPAIQVEAQHLVAGSMALLRRVVEALGEVVTKHYKTSGAEYKETGYTKEH